MHDLDKVIAEHYPQIKGIHPAANIFPHPDDQDYQALKNDIKDKGLLEPIHLDVDGKLIDGRTRLYACFEARQDIRTKIYKGDQWEFALSVNLSRRHLTVGQKAAIAVELERQFAVEALERMSEGGKGGVSSHDLKGRSDVKAAKMVGVGQQAVSRMKFILEYSTELAEKITAGGTTINKAYNYLKERRFNSSDIEWCHYTWNPVTGCKHGCKYCYAKEIANRFADTFPKGFEPHFRPERLTCPANMGKPVNGKNRVFVCSMADLFGDWVDQGWIDAVFKACEKRPEWTYIFLTKNPKRLVGLDFPPGALVGATVDRQRVLDPALDALSQVNSKTFISFEPLLEIIDPTKINGVVDWAVVGLESGNRIGKFIPDIVDLAKMLEKIEVPLFVKPNSAQSFPVQFP